MPAIEPQNCWKKSGSKPPDGRVQSFLELGEHLWKNHALRVLDVPGDGSCGLHSFAVHMFGAPGKAAQISSMQIEIDEFVLSHADGETSLLQVLLS